MEKLKLEMFSFFRHQQKENASLLQTVVGLKTINL